MAQVPRIIQLPYIKSKTVNDILVDTESFACLSKWLIFIVGIISFFAGLSNNTLFILAFAITLIISISFWIHPVFSFVRGTVFLTQPRIFVTITGWFVDKVILIVIGFLTVGWQGLLFYALGYIWRTFLGYVLNVFLAKSKHSQLVSHFRQMKMHSFIYPYDIWRGLHIWIGLNLIIIT